MIGDRAPVIKLAIAAGCDTTQPLFKAIEAIPALTLERDMPAAEQEEALRKGRITGILGILADTTDTAGRAAPANTASGQRPRDIARPAPHYTVHLETAGSAPGSLELLQTLLHEAIRSLDTRFFPGSPSIATLQVTRRPGRIYRQIDFILPGQLGFSLLMAGVFGSSFLLFSLRQSLVLKRLQATPIRRRSIIAGEMLSRLFFHVIGFIIMVALGFFVFRFTLVNGVATFAEMLLFSLFGLGIFMGIGFIISGVIQNESSIAPVANTVVLPQILLCGLFFPIESYPHGLQQFCNILPLTLFVDGLRRIAFEGAHIWQMPVKIAGLVCWTLVIGMLSVKTFKWE